MRSTSASKERHSRSPRISGAAMACPMSPIGTSRTSADVQWESGKCAEADVDQAAIAIRDLMSKRRSRSPESDCGLETTLEHDLCGIHILTFPSHALPSHALPSHALPSYAPASPDLLRRGVVERRAFVDDMYRDKLQGRRCGAWIPTRLAN